jgi:hypothetical protein
VLQGASGGSRVAEGVPGGRFQREGQNQEGPARVHEGGSVQDWGERGGCRVRVVLGEPQRGRGDADVPAFPLWLFDAGEGLLGALGVTKAHQDGHLHGPRPRNDQGRYVEAPAGRSAASKAASASRSRPRANSKIPRL